MKEYIFLRIRIIYTFSFVDLHIFFFSSIFVFPSNLGLKNKFELFGEDIGKVLKGFCLLDLVKKT